MSAGYRQLVHDGWVEYRHGSGVYVQSEAAPAQTPEQILDQHIVAFFKAVRDLQLPAMAISRYSVAWQYAGKEFWVRDHGPAVEIHYSTKRIHVLRGTQARTLRQSLLHRDLSGRDGEITWHGPRHAFCSWLEMAGETTIEIKEPAGHKTMSQAARYAHLSPKHKQSVVDRIAVTLTESKIAGCRRSHHTQHAPALQWQERSEVK